MTSFVNKMKLKGSAEEDIYFAKLDLELIQAIRQKKQKKQSDNRKYDKNNRRTI